MSRYNTQVLSNIRMLCRMQNIDEKVLYERAKLILSIYREVCWSTIDRANDVCDTLICTYGDSLDGALIYLENFAPDEARERFEERIRSLFETKWIIELVDMAMLKIREYPDKGALYCEIISKAYLNRFKYRESEMLEVLNMERSTYYDRKKEAIAINDNYDSAQSQQAGNEIILPFKNLINDSYSRDISIKIRSNLETKRRNGEFVGSHVVYGYRRSDDDKNKLVIDQTVAPVIQSIFSMKMDGFSPAQIADKLNKDGVPSPYEYKRQSGSRYQSGFKKQIQTDWGAKAIYRILKNEMYTGTLVQGKTTTPNHKIKSRTTKDEADWMRTENAHDAIISPSIFDMVQKLMLEDTRSPSGDNSVHLFSGKVFCADCQSTMTRKKTKSAGKEYVYFVCNANKVDRKVCDAHTVKEQVVYDAALAVIQAQVSLALNLEIALGELNGISWERREMERIASKIARQEEVIEHNKQMKAHVYEDFKTEMITREEYFIFKAEFDKNIQEAKEAIARLVGNKNQISSGLMEQQSWLAQFREYENIQELNRRVVVNFIDRIEITEDKQVHVVLNNADQFQAIMEFLEEEKAKANAKKVISFIREVS